METAEFYRWHIKFSATKSHNGNVSKKSFSKYSLNTWIYFINKTSHFTWKRNQVYFFQTYLLGSIPMACMEKVSKCGMFTFLKKKCVWFSFDNYFKFDNYFNIPWNNTWSLKDFFIIIPHFMNKYCKNSSA